jgi:hypothetical protein
LQHQLQLHMQWRLQHHPLQPHPTITPQLLLHLLQ